MKNLLKLTALALIAITSAAHAQEPSQATEYRRPTPGPGPDGVMQPTFLSHRLGTDHAEGISILDMNSDGLPDILSGAYWYQNPGLQGGEWTRHQFRTVGTHGEFVSDCGEWIFDVNHDGLPDLVTAGWISNGLWWYQNPGPSAAPGAMWEKHLITDSYDTEGGVYGDINGDGKPDLALAHYNHSGVLWVDFSGPQPKVHHVGTTEHDGHGIGIADIDHDGKPDLLTPYGWFKNIDADNDKWEWHQDWRLGDAGFPILGYDVNHDGRLDLIYGQGHGYGLYWLEQGGTPQHRTWTRHIIDESFSQSHALLLADIDGDGTPELITGKRYRGHSGADPGSYDPLVIYAYRIRPAVAPHGQYNIDFIRIPISVNGTAGVGTQIIAADLDQDGDIDIAVAGKSGVHFLENLQISKVPKDTREAQQWPFDRKWPFPGEGQEVPQEDGPRPTATPTPPPTAGLGGTSWQLVRFQSSDDKTLTPSDKTPYTLGFAADGRLSARIDCNRGPGTWTSSGPNQLQFGPLALTRAMCPPAPLTTRLEKDLQYVRSYILKDNHLFLSLMADGGIYEFEPAPSAP